MFVYSFLTLILLYSQFLIFCILLVSYIIVINSDLFCDEAKYICIYTYMLRYIHAHIVAISITTSICIYGE